MVVGGGVSGIRAALDLAQFGYGVTLVERGAHLGGMLSHLDYQFPTDHCGMCRMLPTVERDVHVEQCLRRGLDHENIEVLLSTEVMAVSGEVGAFEVMLKEENRYIDPVRCMGCGLCADACPITVPNDFNAGLSTRKAVYRPSPQTADHSYRIDGAACSRCGECVTVCPVGAINLKSPGRREFNVLVVDDEQVVRDSLKEWLQEEEGYSVTVAASGPEALSLLAETPAHLMLADVKMPGMDGVELLAKARELDPELTVIMMTAYATVETAVDAMKKGAIDYLLKPFETDKLIPMVAGVYDAFEQARARRITVGALVLCGGTVCYDPTQGKNTLGYGVYENVVTGLEFERILSGGGPTGGRLVRTSDGKPVSRVAWIQCVGSRDLQAGADYCSSICCMHAVKEARLAREKSAGKLDAVIFYMDMRGFGKSFHRYRDEAETLHGVRFERGRIHTVVPATDGSGDLITRYADETGTVRDERWDMVVLSVGQRPAPGIEILADMTGISRNAWGFAETEAFRPAETTSEGVLVGGAFSGPRDIRDSVIQASAAALAASRVLHGAGGSLASTTDAEFEERDVSREPPCILTALCAGGSERLTAELLADVATALLSDPAVRRVERLDATHPGEGVEVLARLLKETRANRLLIATVMPRAWKGELENLARRSGLGTDFITVMDLGPSLGPENTPADAALGALLHVTRTGVVALRRIAPGPVSEGPVAQTALVVGGGIAGMSAALGIADHGFHVDLVEQTDALGGNLQWIEKDLEGNALGPMLADVLSKVETHPHIEVHAGARVVDAFGQVGKFVTTLKGPEENLFTRQHGVTILATGGTEAVTESYGYNESDLVMTQKELATVLDNGGIDPAGLRQVVMIQCVGSRQPPRNYCSRVCCATSLKHALALKEIQPEMDITILYRDMMSYGFSETWFTRARKAGIRFIHYDLENLPRVEVLADGVDVTVREPIIGRDLQIKADRLILATGVVPTLPPVLAEAYGVDTDQDGFFQEADPKWRPVDALKEGVFGCGLALSPGNITESIASGDAAAQRALRLLVRESLHTGSVVSTVRSSFCTLCERCIDACPYGARSLSEDPAELVVNPLMCQGCGACVVACPSGASVLSGFSKAQMLETIDSACW